MSDGSTQTITITWDNGTPAYDPNTSGTYVFSGILTLPTGTTNSNNLKAGVNVIVGIQPVFSPQAAAPSDPATVLAEQASSSLINGVWNFTDAVFGSQIRKILSIPVIYNASLSIGHDISLFAASITEPFMGLFNEN
jgi:hypothetical protein